MSVYNMPAQAIELAAPDPAWHLSNYPAPAAAPAYHPMAFYSAASFADGAVDWGDLPIASIW